MEKRDLYNENRKLINKTIFKNEDIPSGNYILMVVAFIENLDGRYLIQKRSELKGGEWAFTGGHPKHGESSLEGVKTEIKEELIISLGKQKLNIMDYFQQMHLPQILMLQIVR